MITPAELSQAAACWCLPEGAAGNVLIYELLAWVNGADPAQQGLLENSEGGLIIQSDGGGGIIIQQ